MGILVAIIVIGLLVFIHELGHFTMARINGIKVHEFAMGLGPTLIGKEFKGTKFSIKALPLGGACIMGEDDREDVSDGSFNSKSVWARMAVILGGAFFNLVTALILCIIIVGAFGYQAPVITDVTPGYSAYEEGLQAGDVITRIDGRRVYLWDELTLHVLMNPNRDLSMTVSRDGQEVQVTLEPRQLENDARPRIGVVGSGERVQPGFFGSIQYGAYTMRYWVNYAVQSIRMLVTGQIGVDQLTGPVGLVSEVGNTFEQTTTYGLRSVMFSMMGIATLLSVSFGVFNLLPIPALDGGRFVFLLIEALRRGKRIPLETEGKIHMVGFILLIGLMIFVMGQDIVRLIPGR